MHQYFKSASWYFLFLMVIACTTARRDSGDVGPKSLVVSKEKTRDKKKDNSKERDKAMSERLFPLLTDLKDYRGDSRGEDHAGSQLTAKSISERYQNAISDCSDLPCLAESFKITENEKQAYLATVANPANGLKSFSSTTKFSSYNSSAGEAISKEITSVNYILDVYVAGKKPRYPKIDKASRLADAPQYLSELKKAANELHDKAKRNGSLHHLPRLIALKALELNGSGVEVSKNTEAKIHARIRETMSKKA